jgi:hypothetical protein
VKKADTRLIEIARRAMTTGGGPSTTAAEAMLHACGSLYRVLDTSMGSAGLHALMDRAIQVTAREYPWLASVRTGMAADCPVTGLSEAAERVGIEDATAGYAALLASLLGLLITFIGEELTLRFVRSAWPALALSKLSGGSTNE